MKEIQLTQGKIAIVDDEDFEYLNQFKWYYTKSKSGNAYAQRHIKKSNGKQGTIKMHRIILDIKSNIIIDHIDGNGLNNTRKNLRYATRSQNNENSRKRNGCISIYKGVSYEINGNNWRTRISTNKKIIHIGRFKSEIEAARAYDRAAIKYHGDFARLNFPISDYL